MEQTTTKNITEASFDNVKHWPSAISMDDDLILLNLSEQTPFPSESRHTSFNVFGLITQGELHYDVDTVDHSVTAGQLIVVSERRVVSNYGRSDNLQGMCMALSVPFFREIIRDMSDLSSLFLFTRSHPVMQLTERETSTVRLYFGMIRDRMTDHSNAFRRELVRTLLQAMFFDMSNVIYRYREQATARQSRTDEIFTRFIKLVEANCKHERRVAWYAEQMGITPKYLSETVKSVSKNTPMEWIDNYVTLAIRVLLKDTTKTIKDIADEMNFPNQSFLGKYFRMHVGVSPSEYRRK